MELFGRTLHGVPDVLIGYKKETIRIKGESEVSSSAMEEHVIISYTGNDADVIEGVVLSVTGNELLLADGYETDNYKRISVVLKSGTTGWAYVKNDKP